jgi:hypothetical protein
MDGQEVRLEVFLTVYPSSSSLEIIRKPERVQFLGGATPYLNNIYSVLDIKARGIHPVENAARFYLHQVCRPDPAQLTCTIWGAGVLPIYISKKVSKAISVTGLGGPQGCERLRLPHYLDKRLIDGGKVVSPTRRPHFNPRFLFVFKDSWYSFLLEAETTPGP